MSRIREDASRIRTGASAQNFALLRRTALNQLQRETSVKSSIRMKRYRAAMDNHYAAKVLLAKVAVISSTVLCWGNSTSN